MAIRTIKLKRTGKSWDDSELTAKTLQFGEPLYNANSNDLVIGSTDDQSIGSVTKIFHAVPKTLKGKALYLDGSALKNEDETAVTIDAASSISGVLNVANGGTGQTSAVNAANAFMNALSTGTSTPTDTDYYISQYAGGGTSTTTYHRRPHSALWTYIKGKANAVYAAMSHTHSAGDITSGTLEVARGGTGQTTLQAARNAMGLGNTTGAVPVANGGTGLTTTTNKNAVVIGNSSSATSSLQTVRTASGAFYATAQDSKPAFGTLPVAQGGTGATSAAGARTNLGAAPLASPAFTGNPTAPTQASGNNSTRIATTAFVQSAIASGVTKTANTSATKLYVCGVTAANGALYYNTGVYVNCTKGVLQGAAWNDYAELRKCSETPGTVVMEIGDGSLVKSTKHNQAGCHIISDTFGMIIGPDEAGYKPVAVSGRVLAKYSGKISKYKVGKPVCSGADGKISPMSRLEAIIYPDRIIGMVSEIPTYNKWNDITIGERIWISVK